ncbi:MAG: hypothetical protein N2038_03320 [Geminicoccaceae bacterium]|nr:hypothetical protein [Geminicoccaceae bacterium]MDW8123269.1 hypothetical protein [Geminicoccaceae bacterium]
MAEIARTDVREPREATFDEGAAAPPKSASGLADLLEGEEARSFAELRLALEARYRPVDAVEHALVEAIAAALWRQRRLDLLEERVLCALAAGRSVAGMPSLATLARCRARIERDLAAAEARLARLQAQRPEPAEELALEPAELAELFDRLCERIAPPLAGGAQPAAGVAPVSREEAKPEPRTAPVAASAASSQARPANSRVPGREQAHRIERAAA